MNSENNLFHIEKFVLGPLFTNCFVLSDNKTKKSILVDPGVYDDRVKYYIDEEGLDIIAIINTHGHADHISGDAAFKYPVYIHKEDAPCLNDPRKNLSFLVDEDVTPVKVKRYLKDGDVVEMGEVKLQILHTPGHSPGSISIFCDNVLLSGDVLFYEGIGRTDLPEGDHETLLKTIREKMFILPDNVLVLPGHGQKTTIGHEKQTNPFL